LEQKDEKDMPNNKKSIDKFSIEQEAEKIDSSFRRVATRYIPLTTVFNKYFIERYAGAFKPLRNLDEAAQFLEAFNISIMGNQYSEQLLFVMDKVNYGYNLNIWDLHHYYVNDKEKLAVLKDVIRNLVYLGFNNNNILDFLEDEEQEENTNLIKEVKDLVKKHYKGRKSLKMMNKYLNTTNKFHNIYMPLKQLYDIVEDDKIPFEYINEGLSIMHLEEFNEFLQFDENDFSNYTKISGEGGYFVINLEKNALRRVINADRLSNILHEIGDQLNSL
jgi:hypothetical protein